MIKGKYFISVGYPMGRVQFEEDTYLIQVKDGLYKLSGVQYFVWQLVWQLREITSIEEGFLDNFSDLEIETLHKVLDGFIKNKIIYEIDEDNYDKNYENIKNLAFDKQGMGIGYIPNEEKDINSYEIKLDEIKDVDLLQYMVWCKGDGKTVIEDIIKELVDYLSIDIEENKAYIVQSILGLYKEKLIYFKG